jgi:hypothetical protein
MIKLNNKAGWMNSRREVAMFFLIVAHSNINLEITWSQDSMTIVPFFQIALNNIAKRLEIPRPYCKIGYSPNFIS